MAKQSCSNCGHEVSIGVNPRSYVAGIYHYREKGMILKSKNYSQRCFEAKCPCTNPRVSTK